MNKNNKNRENTENKSLLGTTLVTAAEAINIFMQYQ